MNKSNNHSSYIDDKNKFLNINMLQKFKYENLYEIYKSLKQKEEKDNPRVKPDFVRSIIKSYINKGYKVIGRGLVDICHDSYGFIRSESNRYLSSSDDCFIPLDIINKFNIRSGDFVNYVASKPMEGHKRFSIINIDTINFVPVAKIKSIRPVYDEMRIIYPKNIINLSYIGNATSNSLLRIINTFTPIGFGQRALIVAPPKSGKTTIIKVFANSISTYYSEDSNVVVLILLVGERPEEISEMQDILGDRCEIFHSDFHENSSKHIDISELCMQRAKRLAEMGINVIVFIDSFTRLARAYNANASGSGKTMSGGLEYSALQKTKQLFGIAGNNKNSSITVIGTCLVNTGSKLDDTLHEEFRGTGNCDIILSRILSNRNIFPALDIMPSGTRRSEILYTQNQKECVDAIRKIVAHQHSNNRYYEYVDWMINLYKTCKDEQMFFDKVVTPQKR